MTARTIIIDTLDQGYMISVREAHSLGVKSTHAAINPEGAAQIVCGLLSNEMREDAAKEKADD